eukprot:COSAG06_NODE_19084_length_854_cov_1.201325_1_plen_188_part_01
MRSGRGDEGVSAAAAAAGQHSGAAAAEGAGTPASSEQLSGWEGSGEYGSEGLRLSGGASSWEDGDPSEQLSQELCEDDDDDGTGGSGGGGSGGSGGGGGGGERLDRDVHPHRRDKEDAAAETEQLQAGLVRAPSWGTVQTLAPTAVRVVNVAAGLSASAAAVSASAAAAALAAGRPPAELDSGRDVTE